MPHHHTDSRIGKPDLLILLTIVLWAINLSVIKIGLRELPPHGFNGIRLSIASLVYVVLLVVRRERSALGKGDVWKTLLLGALGIAVYQVAFIRAISLLNASTTSIIMATTPAIIALLSSALGQERIHWAAWFGISLSFAGCVFVVSSENGGFALSGRNLEGAALILISNAAWAVYTVMSKPLLERTSAFHLAALSTSVGTLLYMPFTLKDIASISWDGLSWAAWGAIFYSSFISIVLCFFLWYYSVQKVGSTKTGIYGNLTPVFASIFAVLVLSESISHFQIIGALVVLGGVYLTRTGYRLFEKKLRVSPSSGSP